MFHCIRPTGGCEWQYLCSFVDTYNKQFGTAYKLSKCLDAFDSAQSQPEVLVQCNGQPPMVIERKLVVWPPDYLKFHSSEHSFANDIQRRLMSNFQDKTYFLEIGAANLRGYNKMEMAEIVSFIAKAIIENRDRIISSGRGIRGKAPFQWIFRPTTEFERDENTPDRGVGVFFHDEWEGFDPAQSQKMIEEAIKGIGEGVSNAFASAAKKFQNYSHCIRLVLLELCIGSSLLVMDDDFKRIIQELDLPNCVDQVWRSYPEWISESEQEVHYERIR